MYLIISKSKKSIKTYVGYTNNLKNRIRKHNRGDGAKSTRGYKWKLIYKKKFNTKSEAMSYEHKLKKDRTVRKNILKKFDK